MDRAEDSDQGVPLDRMAREIKGSILTLATLFLLVALTSYIPIDSISLFSGRFDHMHNLGGIVGALVAEWFLGTVGAPGYAIILLSGWISYSAFRGTPLRSHVFRVIGTVLGTVLAAISCHLFLFDQVPEASLLQGGLVGKIAGDTMREYFNTTGALLIVGTGFVITLILTTGFSVTGWADRVFHEGEDELTEEEEEKLARASRPKATVILASGAGAEAPVKKKAPKKKKTDEEGDGEATEELDLGDEVTDPGAEVSHEFREMIPYTGSYDMPSARLLKNIPSDAKKMSKGEMKDNGRKLCEHLLSFGITGEMKNIHQGPVLTTYEFKPSAGMKLSKIEALQDDLGVVLGQGALRIIAPIPGKTVVGIEVPRPKAEVIPLKELFQDKQFADKKLKLPIALGKSTDGIPIFSDLAAMPHLLVAGGTGSGKSVFVNSLIMSLIFRLSPQELRMILVDPKMLELNVFDGLPHLVTNVITDNTIAFNALTWAVSEMERRYALMAKSGSKNIESYNGKVKGKDRIPFLVIIVDELADLMMSGGKDVEVAITRLAQKARAAGIHMVLATQRPSTDVVTGLIKANMPSRISFKVPSGIDSRTVLDAGGAEALMGRGDSLMIQPASPLRRIHGTFVTEEDLARSVKYAKGGKDHQKIYLQFPKTMPSGS